VLGAGGAARAVIAGLCEEGAEVWLTARRSEAAAALASSLGPLRLIPWENREEALADAALLVNTTSGGMTGAPPLSLSLARAAPGLVVADIVYAPLTTPLLAEARARGLKTVDGLGMLLHQAVPGFEAWFGIRPDVDAEVHALLAADLGAAA
jgi:shikimate dehydrogenase